MTKRKALQSYGRKSGRTAKALVVKARARAALAEPKALRLAIAETRRARVEGARRKTTGAAEYMFPFLANPRLVHSLSVNLHKDVSYDDYPKLELGADRRGGPAKILNRGKIPR